MFRWYDIFNVTIVTWNYKKDTQTFFQFYRYLMNNGFDFDYNGHVDICFFVDFNIDREHR